MSEVHNPTHYTSHPSGLEAIEITENLPFNLGNAIKYLWRKNHKGNHNQDIEKALWYLNREKKRFNNQKADLERLKRYATEHDDPVSKVIIKIVMAHIGIAGKSAEEIINECIEEIKRIT